ncbi:MAG: flagellar hook-basal body complex protein FliE [Rhizobiales bacterium]|nr:flagellar hook-basal body complex protein FliE [Hyphomicrobiales bacterium]MBO6697757.1 flagellar hook-basal body complex protein FliE [Hyphomicrobiales bacterium]MBO6735988.1 flagellar hook-basal body complex protein FliE [Hyphomicrobiales bacterium]MBO6912458.1 flagellar hook-basal body complex protein FliE [Hyphomicrobiales bacterium]MBO6955088.1 flagellar hook-basal body complex protein FliE [Hyphomicrobiales bacterium]
MTSIPTNQAIQAYAQAAQALSGNGQGGTQPAASDAAEGFGALIEQQATNLVNEGQAFEAAGMDLVQGRADVVDVVTAVAETEVLLETVVTVRDRVIQAYQEILRMPI